MQITEDTINTTSQEGPMITVLMIFQEEQMTMHPMITETIIMMNTLATFLI
jgi:hypothetical protein